MRLRHHLAAGAMAVGLTGLPGWATADDAEVLIDALRVGDTVEIMRQEGLRYGADLGVEMLPGVNTARWGEVVSRIYDPEKMEAVITDGFETAFEGKDLEMLVAFFTSETGSEIIELELSAREAFLDQDTEMAAMDAYEVARDDQTRLFEQVEEIISDSDLVEFNVMGAMNANLMFYRGLLDGGAIEMGEEEMLADVWAQEEDIRGESEAWLGSFLMLAYRPLEEAELEAYAELYRTPEGKVLNTAIFEAYDQMYEEISYLLGQAVAQQMQSEEL
ncbi:MAG: DUF2059 domain-containing protein [Pseudomonadota bacterium]